MSLVGSRDWTGRRATRQEVGGEGAETWKEEVELGVVGTWAGDGQSLDAGDDVDVDI